MLQLDTVCQFRGQLEPTIANKKMRNRQCLQAFRDDSQRNPNGAKVGFMTSDQKVAGSSPGGCTSFTRDYRGFSHNNGQRSFRLHLNYCIKNDTFVKR
jgi:hypothetical protein